MRFLLTISVLFSFVSCELPTVLETKHKNDNDNSVTTIDPVTAIELSYPSGSTSLHQTPSIIVSGVSSGDTVKLYTDSTCETEVATGCLLYTSPSPRD